MFGTIAIILKGPTGDNSRPTVEGLYVVEYQHTQKAPLRWMIQLAVIVMLALAWIWWSEPALALILISVALVLLLVSFSFGSLTVRGDGEGLVIRYGPLPLFRTEIAYASISAAERSRTSILDGWGIHWLPGRGLVYNLWGFDCVRLVVRGRTIRIGSDDADNLADFLNDQIER